MTRLCATRARPRNAAGSASRPAGDAGQTAGRTGATRRGGPRDPRSDRSVRETTSPARAACPSRSPDGNRRCDRTRYKRRPVLNRCYLRDVYTTTCFPAPATLAAHSTRLTLRRSSTVPGRPPRPPERPNHDEDARVKPSRCQHLIALALSLVLFHQLEVLALLLDELIVFLLRRVPRRDGILEALLYLLQVLLHALEQPFD